ncbi:uncharacterized protein LOC110011683 [Sesamum indicum]|uniref:Uncharacterized protein LOC110011683 n=1 Tax=Sesamum indicum TaxID=4182 RepID=A0A8M8UVI5_SESIN|nr:uncharacterized protein LOC110011683 [Sesamum indicum]
MSNDRYVLEAGTSRCKKQLLEFRASTSNHMVAEKSSEILLQEDVHRWRRKAEIEQLEARLRVLEEEAEMLKGALLESVEERAKLMNEVNEHFQTIRHCLRQKEIEKGELCGHGVRIVSTFKDTGAGLLQILCQESNPSLVNRRASALS